ncbi:hypothetical protein EVG20_g10459 [Dentipellis fragilis]|uniref:Peptidase A1 domain-containing protein n=1 Tax=Dentipellis fragilis TaxID=205917 RepID=A0A4Y9XQR2_9AGAM|nr:hypothetical protein EVG20_g10459 [Dentipellis fragilis]
MIASSLELDQRTGGLYDEHNCRFYAPKSETSASGGIAPSARVEDIWKGSARVAGWERWQESTARHMENWKLGVQAQAQDLSENHNYVELWIECFRCSWRSVDADEKFITEAIASVMSCSVGPGLAYCGDVISGSNEQGPGVQCRGGGRGTVTCQHDSCHGGRVGAARAARLESSESIALNASFFPSTTQGDCRPVSKAKQKIIHLSPIAACHGNKPLGSDARTTAEETQELGDELPQSSTYPSLLSRLTYNISRVHTPITAAHCLALELAFCASNLAQYLAPPIETASSYPGRHVDGFYKLDVACNLYQPQTSLKCVLEGSLVPQPPSLPSSGSHFYILKVSSPATLTLAPSNPRGHAHPFVFYNDHGIHSHLQRPNPVMSHSASGAKSPMGHTPHPSPANARNGHRSQGLNARENWSKRYSSSGDGRALVATRVRWARRARCGSGDKARFCYHQRAPVTATFVPTNILASAGVFTLARVPCTPTSPSISAPCLPERTPAVPSASAVCLTRDPMVYGHRHGFQSMRQGIILSCRRQQCACRLPVGGGRSRVVSGFRALCVRGVPNIDGDKAEGEGGLDTLLFAGQKATTPAIEFGVAEDVTGQFPTLDEDGVLGLGLPGFDDAPFNPTNKGEHLNPPFMQNLLAARVIPAKITGWKLPRTKDVGSVDSLAFGSLDPTHFIPGTLISLRAAQTSEQNPKPWGISATAASMNGVAVLVKPFLGFIDFGTTVIVMSDIEADVLNSRITGAVRVSPGVWHIPCNTQAKLALTIGTKVWPVDPRDLVSQTVPGSPNLCESNIEGDENEPVGQWILGGTFLKNVCTVLVEDGPQVGLAQPRYIDVDWFIAWHDSTLMTYVALRYSSL